MLIDKKERFVKLTAEGFGRGVISFNRDMNSEISNFKNIQWEFSGALIQWLDWNKKDFLSEDMKELTDKLYNEIIHGRVQGFIIGVLDDLDMDKEIKKLSDEIAQLWDKNNELKQDNIRLANELADKQHILDSYESSAFKRES